MCVCVCVLLIISHYDIILDRIYAPVLNHCVGEGEMEGGVGWTDFKTAHFPPRGRVRVLAKKGEGESVGGAAPLRNKNNLGCTCAAQVVVVAQ